MCPHYGQLWAADWRRVLFDNLGQLDRLTPGCPLPGSAAMLTVTAPGARPVWDPATGEIICDALPWDLAWCAHLGEHRCSGKTGCRVEPYKAADWNRTADARWSKMHRAAGTATRRRFGPGALVMLDRVIELQKRGVKHVHPVFLTTTPRQRQAVEFYAKWLSERSARYAFGFVDRKVEPKPGKSAAAYGSSYIVTGKKGKLTLQESVQHPSMRRSRVIWMTPKLTGLTGVTMRELRFRRFVWVRFGSMLALGGKWIDVARRLAEIERELGRPLTGDELASVTMGVLGTLRTTFAGEAGDDAAQTA
jgi:hypothetical protein